MIQNIFSHYALKATAEIQMEEFLPREESQAEGKGLLQRVERLQVGRRSYSYPIMTMKVTQLQLY